MGEQGEYQWNIRFGRGLRDFCCFTIFRTLPGGFFFIEIPIVEVKQGHDYQGGRDNQRELVGNEISYVGLVDKFGGKGCVCRAGALVEQRCGGNDG